MSYGGPSQRQVRAITVVTRSLLQNSSHLKFGRQRLWRVLHLFPFFSWNIFRLLAALWYYFIFLKFNQSGTDRNLHTRVPAWIWKMSLANYQIVHTISFWVTTLTEIKIKKGYSLKQPKVLLRFTSQENVNETKSRLQFLDKSIQCRLLLKNIMYHFQYYV